MDVNNLLIQNLQNPKIYEYKIDKIELIETHISWIILTGKLAYKIKKPVNLGFADFSTLEKRKFYCLQELKLNHRLAKELYIKVIPITGTISHPILNGTEEPIEYALVMNQFSQSSVLANLHKNNQLTKDMMLSIASQLANLHKKAEIVNQDSHYGSLASIKDPMTDNFVACKKLTNHNSILQDLTLIENATNAMFEASKEIFLQRKKKGFIKSCHGDVHLGNIALINNKVVIFDCIEFNDEFRFIDVMNEVAYIVMDLFVKKAKDLAFLLLNKYFEFTGDYSGIDVLKFYIVYRAMVKAKVALLTPGKDNEQECNNYLTVAKKFIAPYKPIIMIMHGVSGSGKSFVGKELAMHLVAIRIRADLERKRIFDKDKREQNEELYSANMTELTYKRLVELTKLIINAKFDVIVDATFINKRLRDMFIKLQYDLNVPLVIVETKAPKDILIDRITTRKDSVTNVSNANIEILEQQLKNLDKLDENERAITVSVDTSLKLDVNDIVKQIMAYKI